MTLARESLSAGPRPADGWPEWVLTAPYVSANHPESSGFAMADGANCQSFAYAVLALFALRVPPHRSSELWADPAMSHPSPADARDLDLVLFSADGRAWGAHVAVALGGSLLHLSAEVGTPALWSWEEFAARPRYAHLVGLVRVPGAGPNG